MLGDYDFWKCAEPFDPDAARDAADPHDECERMVEALTAEIGLRDARLEALEVELAALREHSEFAHLLDEVHKGTPGSYLVALEHRHFVTEHGLVRETEVLITWWPTEGSDAQLVKAPTASEALAKFIAAVEGRS